MAHTDRVQLKDQYQRIEVSSFFLLLDPFFRYWFCGFSPFFCKKYKDKRILLDKVQEKFVDELDVKKMIEKIRMSQDILANMVG